MVCDDPLEQYSLVISIPEASEFIKLKPVKVFKRINISENNDYSLKYLPKAGILVLDGEIRIHKSALDGIDISFDSSMPGYSNFVKAISKKELFLKPKYITLKRVIISVQDFFYLLSPITQIIACTKLTFTSEIMFVDVLKKSPILEELSFFKTKIKVSDTWVEDLQLYGRKLIKLCVNIENINFNVKVLADIIKVRI
uniref:Uncharacterized protein n=1 Tax=Panagrolaimus sp. ES5 TaxID=591445 RepID=A0AC34FYS0_9BILA